jgi:thymidine kinase
MLARPGAAGQAPLAGDNLQPVRFARPMSKLYFRYAAMNAGKSTSLLQAAHNYEERGMRVRIFTAAQDDRAGFGVVGSRLGLQRQSEAFGADTVFDAAWLGTGVACLLIDEAQFLSPTQVRQLHRLAHAHHVPVLCYGLRSDFRGEAFPGAVALLTLADSLEELKTICACGRKASMNLRVDAQGKRVREGEQVMIGGNESYRAVCPSCFYNEDDDPAAAPGLFG